MNRPTGRRPLRAVPALVLLTATVTLAVPAHAAQPTAGGGDAAVNTVVISGPGPGDGGPK